MAFLTHHGSKRSHLEGFWVEILEYNKEIKLVTLENTKYNHPNIDVASTLLRKVK